MSTPTETREAVESRIVSNHNGNVVVVPEAALRETVDLLDHVRDEADAHCTRLTAEILHRMLSRSLDDDWNPSYTPDND